MLIIMHDAAKYNDCVSKEVEVIAELDKMEEPVFLRKESIV